MLVYQFLTFSLRVAIRTTTRSLSPSIVSHSLESLDSTLLARVCQSNCTCPTYLEHHNRISSYHHHSQPRSLSISLLFNRIVEYNIQENLGSNLSILWSAVGWKFELTGVNVHHSRVARPVLSCCRLIARRVAFPYTKGSNVLVQTVAL